ncbi:MAG: hypothetical protein HEQ40_03250 [Lacibacter sp.]|jgi:hypothetical protein
MKPQSKTTGGFLKSSLFAALIYLNYIVSIAFIVVMLFHAVYSAPPIQEGAIGQNPLQQSVSDRIPVQESYE